MIKRQYLFSIFFFTFFALKAQETKKGILNIKKIGFLYNYADENNFLFDDVDYNYTTNTLKLQAFYDLGTWKNWKFDLIVQPQIQTIKHQLINIQFVLPSEEDYLTKRTEFTTPKTMYLYGFELGFVLKRELVKKLDFEIIIGLGLAAINTRTERLAKGFTFIENGSLGFSYQTTKKTSLYLGSNIGHVSNFDTKKPNNGYSFLGFEIGLSYLLK
ncbi:acyloxyacyl hydrolase [Polaribacter sp. Hel1_85]|uniref:acyloxyacyl hydrolase n=1 Tax=Polaribacter sp. Hel1_85 TaxID=1250005 RepID=UPI00052C7550|nr:acyloxyacyl hydrolase [Polaribacter sp. Hel1_85]KGL63191.1 lipid A 3-O-deacylase-like protein [Polaribacter sp. Hel1_85]